MDPDVCRGLVARCGRRGEPAAGHRDEGRRCGAGAVRRENPGRGCGLLLYTRGLHGVLGVLTGLYMLAAIGRGSVFHTL